MLATIKNFFDSRLSGESADPNQTAEQRTNLACAALLIEVINSDHELDQRENEEFLAVLRESLGLAEADLQELVELAREENRQATSLYEFTRLINDNFDYEQKVALIENMWRIAFSDEQLDKYEEHLIRRTADLIYVSHSDFIQTKLRARKDKQD